MSIASAPEDLAASFVDEDLQNVVPVAQSELNVKISKRKQKFSEKGKSFLKELRAKRKETAFRNLKRKLDHIKTLREDPQTELEVLEGERNELDSLKDVLSYATHTKVCWIVLQKRKNPISGMMLGIENLPNKE